MVYENSELQKEGALVELSIALSDRAGLSSSFDIMPWARAYETALQQPNTVLLAVLKTTQRESELQWIGKVLEAKAYLIALKERTDIQLNNIEQAKEYLTASVRGYGSAGYLLRQGFSEDKNLILTSHQSQMWGILYNKRVDLVISTLKIGRFEVKEIGLDPSLLTGKLQIQELTYELQIATGLLTPPATVTLLRDTLSSLKKDGTYDAIFEKWDLN